MIRSTSKKAIENLRAYILDIFSPENYVGYSIPTEDDVPTEWNDVCKFILATFRDEKWWCQQDYQYYKGSEQAAFFDWCAGLPSVIDTCYYYNRSAADDLARILEETEEEKNKYSETEAEKMLTWLIYRELRRTERMMAA